MKTTIDLNKYTTNWFYRTVTRIKLYAQEAVDKFK